MKKVFCLPLAALLLLLCGCHREAVPVQPVSQLTQATKTPDRYFGEVVSSQTVEVNRDTGKTVKQRFVSVGQTVKKGEKLFSYDQDAARIEAEKLKLEIEKMEHEQKNLREQLSDLEKRSQNAGSGSEQNRLSLEISTLKSELLESEYRLKGKQKEQEAMEKGLKTAEVLSPVDGVVQKVSETEEGPFMVIRQTGDFRIKGLVNELKYGDEIVEGTAVQVISRQNEEKTWTGKVRTVEKEPAVREGENNPPRSSAYPFYVELDSNEGLLLGQHVYLETVSEEAENTLWLPKTYVENIKTYPMEGKTTAAVWLDNGEGQLKQASVILGNPVQNRYPVISGLSGDDWIADPTGGSCREGAPTEGRTVKPAGTAPAAKETTQMEKAAEENQEEMPEKMLDEMPDETQPEETTKQTEQEENK